MAAEPPAGLPARLTFLVRVYTRAFLAQGVGLVGLAWCLAADLPLAAAGLTLLVLADQAVFLRGRAALPGGRGLQAGLDAWCLLVSFADLMLFCATLFRRAGLREVGGGPVSSPLDCLAFAVATLARLDIGLVPASGGGRLAAAAVALAGDLILLGGVAALAWAAARRASGVSRP